MVGMKEPAKRRFSISYRKFRIHFLTKKLTKFVNKIAF